MKSPLDRLLYRVRDLRSRRLFFMLQKYCHGNVLDVGGWDFVETAIRHDVWFDRWVTLERDITRLPVFADPRVRLVHGDGCEMGVRTGYFDTVLSIQVLEHVFEPLLMVEEISRSLRPGGHAIFLIPQTSTVHLAPHFHSNFSKYWIAAALERSNLELLEHHELGGVWSSMASHLVHFFLQARRTPGMSDASIRRTPVFWALLPFQAIVALLAIPVCMIFSLGDLKEEPNNHLVVARRLG